MIDFEALAAPFPPDRISWRVGATNLDKQGNPPPGKEPRGMALAYIDARDVMARLDEVCGPDGWQCSYPHANGKTVCSLAIKCGDEWVAKSDGAGDTEYEAEKGALSDAFKRAAVRWGIGRYLYDLPSPWVAIELRGRSAVIKEEERNKLEDLLARYTGELEWGSPGEKAMARALYNTIRTTVQTADDVRRYREQNEGVLRNLRKAPREQIDALLARITETYNAKAA